MKLGGIYEGSVYGSEYRTILVESGRSHFEHRGRLPVPARGRDGLLFRLKTDGLVKPLVESYVGRFPTVNIWYISSTTFVASADKWLFVSDDGGYTWRKRLELPPSSGPMGVLPTGFCIHGDAWYVGEYPLDAEATPHVRRSTDRGRTWEIVCSLTEARHVHSVQTDPYTGELWITTGDVGHGCAIGRLDGGEFDRLGSGDQRWRAVELAFTPSSVIWGMDCGYTPAPEILAVRRDDFDAAAPTVETLHQLDSPVYYATTLETADAHWVVFSTTMEAGIDSTAPEHRRQSYSERARVVAASSTSGYSDWYELASFEKRTVPADTYRISGSPPPANAYVFLASDPQRGVLLNPYNTAANDGDILEFPPSYFEDHEPGQPIGNPIVTAKNERT